MDSNTKGYKTFTKVINSWVGGNWNQYRLNPTKCKQLQNYIIKHGEQFKHLYRVTDYKKDEISRKKVGDTITLNVCSTSDMRFYEFLAYMPDFEASLPNVKHSKQKCVYEIKNAFGIACYKYLNKTNKYWFEYQKEVVVFGEFKITNIRNEDEFIVITLEYIGNGIDNLKQVSKNIIQHVVKYYNHVNKHDKTVHEIRSNVDLSQDEEDELINNEYKKFKPKENRLYRKTVSYSNI